MLDQILSTKPATIFHTLNYHKLQPYLQELDSKTPHTSVRRGIPREFEQIRSHVKYIRHRYVTCKSTLRLHWDTTTVALVIFVPTLVAVLVVSSVVVAVVTVFLLHGKVPIQFPRSRFCTFLWHTLEARTRSFSYLRLLQRPQ